MTSPHDYPANGEEPWPLIAIMAGVFFMPYRAGRQLVDRGLGSAMVAHLLILSAVAALISSYTIWSAQWTGTAVSDVLSTILSASNVRWLKLTPATLIVGACLVELCFWALATCILTPWMGVNDSQLGQFRHALILGGYVSAWFLPLTIELLSVTLIIQTRHSYMLVEMLTWIFGSLPVLVMIYLLLALRMARGYGDAVRQVDRGDAIICESCGYDLRATDFDGRCPECGEPAVTSFSPIYRVNGWECGLVGYWATWREVMLFPDRFFRSIRGSIGLTAARRFMILSCLISCIAILVIAIAGATLFPPYSRMPMMTVSNWTFARALAILSMWLYAAIGLPLLLAVLVNNALRRLACLNAGITSLKITCYMTSFAVPVAVIMGLFDVMANLARRQGFSYDQVAEMMRLPTILVTSAICGWIWMVGRRSLRWLRWANT